MIRYHFVHQPLLNYTDYKGNLIEKKTVTKDYELIPLKLTYSPRFIHFDELQLYYFLNSLFNDQLHDNKWFDRAQYKFRELYGIDIPNENIFNQNNINEWTINYNQRIEKIGVGIANLNVHNKDIIASIEVTPNLNVDRQDKIYNLLNSVEKENCDLFVLPEVSIPYFWLNFMVSHARKQKIGLIFGLEHWIINKKAYNFIVTVLPFKKGNYRNALVRLRTKKHYAPKEKDIISSYGYKLPETKDIKYDLFHWNGAYFTVFNCFEISNIEDRALFKAKIDMLIDCEYNPDISYFKNIADSACRDLHCYVIKVNSSHFGDSRILAPMSEQKKNKSSISGGENFTFLKSTLNLSKLRNFQHKGHTLQRCDDEFKPTPADFNTELVIKRKKGSRII